MKSPIDKNESSDIQAEFLEKTNEDNKFYEKNPFLYWEYIIEKFIKLNEKL